MTLTATMRRRVHAVVEGGTEYRSFLERSEAEWKDSTRQVPRKRSSRDPVDDVRACYPSMYLVLRRVSGAARPGAAESCAYRGTERLRWQSEPSGSDRRPHR